jgi:hypothetical protein
VHYWQGAEEIRVYGPLPNETSKPTDERNWSCDQEFHMRGVDAQSIQLDSGRWYFEPEACEKASNDQASFPGCVMALAGGPGDPNHPSPPTFPQESTGHDVAPRPTPAPPAPKPRPGTSAAPRAQNGDKAEPSPTQ